MPGCWPRDAGGLIADTAARSAGLAPGAVLARGAGRAPETRRVPTASRIPGDGRIPGTGPGRCHPGGNAATPCAT